MWKAVDVEDCIEDVAVGDWNEGYLVRPPNALLGDCYADICCDFVPCCATEDEDEEEEEPIALDDFYPSIVFLAEVFCERT